MAQKPTTAEIAADDQVATGIAEMSLVHDWDDDEVGAVMAIGECLLRAGHNPGAVAGIAAALWEGAKRLYPLIVEKEPGSNATAAEFLAMCELSEIFQTRGYPLDSSSVFEVYETLAGRQKRPAEKTAIPQHRWWNYRKSP